jgi:hypothetical protein
MLVKESFRITQYHIFGGRVWFALLILFLERQIRSKVSCFSYLGRVLYAPPDLVKREEVFEYPTDFRAMKQADITRLAKRGEQLTRALIAYYCLEL